MAFYNANWTISSIVMSVLFFIQGDQKVSVHLTVTVPTQLMIWRWPSQNTLGMWTVLYWTRSSRTQFSVSINVWRLAGDTLNIICNFLYCNHQVHRDFLITLYYFSMYLYKVDGFAAGFLLCIRYNMWIIIVIIIIIIMYYKLTVIWIQL